MRAVRAPPLPHHASLARPAHHPWRPAQFRTIPPHFFHPAATPAPTTTPTPHSSARVARLPAPALPPPLSPSPCPSRRCWSATAPPRRRRRRRPRRRRRRRRRRDPRRCRRRRRCGRRHAIGRCSRRPPSAPPPCRRHRHRHRRRRRRRRRRPRRAIGLPSGRAEGAGCRPDSCRVPSCVRVYAVCAAGSPTCEFVALYLFMNLLNITTHQRVNGVHARLTGGRAPPTAASPPRTPRTRPRHSRTPRSATCRPRVKCLAAMESTERPAR